MSDYIVVDGAHGGSYTISQRDYDATCAAKRAGAEAKAAGVRFHDNPYRTGPVTPDDWLYSAWEYGYTYGAGPEALGTVRGLRGLRLELLEVLGQRAFYLSDEDGLDAAMQRSEQRGRAFYESKCAHAAGHSPYRWTEWDRLWPWEHEREEATATRLVRERWALDHPEATDWPAAMPEPIRWIAGEPVFKEHPEPICLCPAASEYDPPCPKHGIRPIGALPDGSYKPNEYER